VTVYKPLSLPDRLRIAAHRVGGESGELMMEAAEHIERSEAIAVELRAGMQLLEAMTREVNR
jgi:hypothetical protein